MHLAVARGATNTVDALLEAGANPNAVSVVGIMPLNLAARGAGEKETVILETGPLKMPVTIRSLWEHGAKLDPPAQPGVVTPLMDAIKHDTDAALALARISQCAVQRCTAPVGANPTRQMSFQPVASGTAVEVTNRSKLLM